MPVPTNTSFATALDIGTTLPFSISQDPSGILGDSDYKLYYKYTGQLNDIIIGVWAKALVSSNYDTFMLIYLETSPGVWNELDLFIEPYQVPCQLPITPGTTYFFEVYQSNSGVAPNANLTFSVLPGPTSATQLGSVLFTDFSPGFPAVILSPSDGSILNFNNTVPSGDFGDILPNGIVAVIDNSTNSPHIKDISADISTLIADVTGITYLTKNRNKINANGLDKFYIGATNGVPTTTIKRFVAADGSIDADSWSFSGFPAAIGVNRANSIFYWSNSTGIHRHDLGTDLPLSDLVGAISNYNAGKDLLIMSDGTILVPYEHSLLGAADFVKRYDSSGALLNTFTLPVNLFIDRIALDVDDSADTFWYCYLEDAATMIFRNIQISDGSILIEFPVPVFNNGISEQTYADDMDRFGLSNSCPLLILREGTEPPPVSTTGGIYKITPGKRNDTLWDTGFMGTTDVKIP
jgi:hypothetical protein